MKFIQNNITSKAKALVAVLALLVTAFATPVLAQVCTSATPSVLAKWDFNTNAPIGCPGEKTYYYEGGTIFQANLYKYCPPVNSGCGDFLLGSKALLNTWNFRNALCLYTFYAWDGSSFPTWDPDNLVNMYIKSSFPAGKPGKITSFNLKVLQQQFDGTTLNFAKQGVAVYRDGVLIYSTTQPILAANINGTPMSFVFPTTNEFYTDGSKAVEFTIVFGLVQRLIAADGSQYAPSNTGYDDICVNGSCGGPIIPNISSTPSTCNAPNGKITLSNFDAAYKYDYTIGSTYTGTATYASGSTTIPANGIIASNLPNPSSPQAYTVRIFTPTCYFDEPVMLSSIWCPTPPVACVTPTGAVLTAVQSTCSAANIAQSDAQVQVTGVTVGDKVAISPGSTYTGGLYATATALASGAYTFTGLPNPTGTQEYTVRVFNGTDDCIKDYTVTLTEKSCGLCKTANFHVYSNQVIDSPTTNNYAPLTVCTGTQKINLNLTKTVAPSTGTTCPTNTPFVWTVTINNTGNMAATDIQVADILPSGLVYISNTASAGTFSTNGGWVIPSLAIGSSATLTITTKATMAGTFKNIAEIMTALPLNDPNSTPGNGVTTEDDYATASITVTGPNPPKITKEFSPMLTKPNTPTRLTIKITNNEATPVTLSSDFIDNLPSTPAQMVIAATPNLQTTLTGVIATAAATSITIPKGTTLLPGLNQLSVEVTVPGNGKYCNDIAVGALKTSSCDNIEAAQACIAANSAFVMAPMLKKTMLPATIQTGQNATLTLSIENRNAVAMNLDQDFIDYLPAGLVMAGTPTSSCGSLTVSAQNSNKELKIASGGSIPANTICTITVPVTSGTAGSYCNVIIMNAILTTVGAINNLGNQDIAEACVKVVATPCTAIDVTAITPSPASPFTTGTAVVLTPTITGAGSQTVYQWSATPNTGDAYYNNRAFVTPTWTPTVAGNYTIKIVVDNSITGYGVCKDSLSINVVVTTPAGPCTPITAATATATPSSIATGASAALSVSATAAGTPVYTYSWVSSPAGFTSTLQNPSTGALATAGGYSYTVTVTNSDGTGTCTITATTSLTVSTAAPTCTPPTGVSITITPSTVITGGSINLASASTGATNWAWDNGSGFTSTLQNPGASTAPAIAGTYTYTVTASHSANATCTATATGTLNVSATPTCTPPTGVSITITPSTIATGGSINLASASTGATNWSWNNGSGFTSTLQNPGASTAPASAGTYTYTVTASHSANTTCTATATGTLSVSSSPTCTPPTGVSITITPSTIATGGSINLASASTGATNWAWSNGNGFTSTLQNPGTTTAPATANTYTYTVTASHSANATCTATATGTLSVSVVPGCTMSATIIQSACNNNGTPTTIPKAIADDYFNVTLTATNGASVGTYQVVLASNVVGSGTYGTSVVVSGAGGLLKADGTSIYTLTIRDQTDNTCNTTKNTTVVTHCSTACPPQLCPIVTMQKN